ncbi:hypothetical protein [Paenibacillus sp. IHBB 3054]|uniref:hypothetical protein n=1 Tax=Paenibacillus sp. IHBB 3054 TaxID=3425689 RepID=UPI003F6669C9
MIGSVYQIVTGLPAFLQKSPGAHRHSHALRKLVRKFPVSDQRLDATLASIRI